MRRRFLWFCCKHRSLKDTSGHFLKKITNTATSTSVPLSTFVTMEASADASMDSGHAAGECIIVLKAAAFVSFKGCLLQRGTCLW